MENERRGQTPALGFTTSERQDRTARSDFCMQYIIMKDQHVSLGKLLLAASFSRAAASVPGRTCARERMNE